MTNLLTKNENERSYNLEQWKQGYQSQPHEYDYFIDDIDGEIPPELQGTLFRNGPGLLDVQGIPLKHPFDGDGMICAISFLSDGKVHFRNRFVQTEGYVKEQKAGKMLYRGVFGSQKPGGWFNNFLDIKIKNIANTNIIYWGDKLLALWEAAEPYRLDPATLETLGLDYLDGTLNPGDSISAHPCIDPTCELDNGQPCLVNYSIKPGFSSKITVYEFAKSGELLRSHSHSIPGFCFIHDFAITSHYCIFLQNSVTFNPLPYILGFCGAGECVDFHPNQPTRLIIIPRTPPYEDIRIIETQAGFVFHHANAFEEGKTIYLDSICYASLPQMKPEDNYQKVDFDTLDPGKLWRFTIDLNKNTVQNKLLENRSCEFPNLHPDKIGRDYRYLYLGTTHNSLGNAPLQAILKLDVKTKERQVHSFAPQGYVGEPIFVPKPNGTSEDEGWVLTLVYDGIRHRSDLVILDGQNLEKSPLATLHLKHHIPYGLHGNWTNEVFI
ncbi:carotenoid oxygenase family protein [Aphanothece sacrum]|uniref:Lignostilbene-alpha,beta-dioxygenase n=1 Tax=Aphanothece sacrum FPU1 TaxID=1920663 RepID=A0A401IEH7_APHSA|nr:carotenoid oxygenase family protein [Aphanothece sacrum]GBF79580.1 lignostilbene-alpha,beta-dioxygenase [Aphanothece sacrum FPU1]GBF87039.1 lignostilbene-alpha,beta-dioxygenase [Aphanothece sacrum FPU3]